MENCDTYSPTADEEYMNAQQLQYFETMLVKWRNNIIAASETARTELRELQINTPDLFDVASTNTGFAMGVEDIERNKKNLVKIDRALDKIQTGEYGYCEVTEDEIGLKRLMAQPVATLCIEVQEMLERNRQVPGPLRPVECFV